MLGDTFGKVTPSCLEELLYVGCHFGKTAQYHFEDLCCVTLKICTVSLKICAVSLEGVVQCHLKMLLGINWKSC